MRTVTTTDEGNRTADGWNLWSAVRHSENATEQSMPFRNARKHTTKYDQQREREPQSNNTGDDERAKAETTKNDKRQSTTTAAPPSIVATPVFFDRGKQRRVKQQSSIQCVCLCVQESGLFVCVVLLFAALIERLICPFLKPLWFLRPPSLPLCVLAIVEGPFQGHPANTFAVLLATLVVDKQCLVACAWRRRCGAVEVNRRQRKRQRRSSQQSKQQNTQRNRKWYVPKTKREAQRNGGMDGQTKPQQNCQKMDPPEFTH